MTKTCPHCGREFDAHARKSKYCSVACKCAAKTREALDRKIAYAAKIGMTLVEFERELRSHRITMREVEAGTSLRSTVKTYREIQHENRRRRVLSGWRGQPVMGGGIVLRHDGYCV